MKEPVSLPSSGQLLSPKQRLRVLRILNTLTEAHFEELLFALNPPSGIIPPNTAPRCNRTIELLAWLKCPTGPGLDSLYEILEDLDGVDFNPPKPTKPSKRLSFAIAGSIDDVDYTKLQAIVKVIQEMTGDDSIVILDVETGSIKLTLGGTSEGLEHLKKLIESEELLEILGTPIEYAFFNLSNTYLVDADLSGADLSGADLSRADLSGADLSQVNLHNATLCGTNLSGANLFKADLSGADLHHANLSEANLFKVNLIEANLTDANLTDANLNNAKLFKVVLDRAKVEGTVFHNAIGLTDQEKEALSNSQVLFQDSAPLGFEEVSRTVAIATKEKPLRKDNSFNNDPNEEFEVSPLKALDLNQPFYDDQDETLHMTGHLQSIDPKRVREIVEEVLQALVEGKLLKLLGSQDPPYLMTFSYVWLRRYPWHPGQSRVFDNSLSSSKKEQLVARLPESVPNAQIINSSQLSEIIECLYEKSQEDLPEERRIPLSEAFSKHIHQRLLHSGTVMQIAAPWGTTYYALARTGYSPVDSEERMYAVVEDIAQYVRIIREWADRRAGTMRVLEQLDMPPENRQVALAELSEIVEIWANKYHQKGGETTLLEMVVGYQ